jgi:hypothetical protein
VKILSKEKIKVLAEKNGWSLARAEGHVDGETYRRRGKLLSAYAQIGIDDYCLGFRAAYYERQSAQPTASFSRLPAARLALRQPAESGETIAAATFP